MRVYKLLINLSQMGSTFIEIFDAKALKSILPHGISRQYGSLKKFIQNKIVVIYLDYNNKSKWIAIKIIFYLKLDNYWTKIIQDVIISWLWFLLNFVYSIYSNTHLFQKLREIVSISCSFYRLYAYRIQTCGTALGYHEIWK